jgi:hypothetical protein
MAFKISRMNSRDISRAYALVERAIPGLELGHWTALTASMDLRKAWFVAKDGEGYVRGICHVAVRGEGDRRRQLEVPLLVAVGLLDSREIERGLLNAAKAYAVAQGCSLLHVWTAVPSNWATLIDYLEHGPWDHGLILTTEGDDDPDQPIRPVKM